MTISVITRTLGRASLRRAVESVEQQGIEGVEIVVVAEVPGVGLNDLELRIQHDKVLCLSTKPGARLGYRKNVELGAVVDADTVRASCRNGILEVRVRKKKS